MLCVAAVFVSCTSGDDGTTDEYYNWQSRNDAYFEQIYQQAADSILEAQQAGKVPNWYIIRSYAKHGTTDYKNCIVVKVLGQDENHTELVNGLPSGYTDSPLPGDSCRLTYRGNLMPSDSYKTVLSDGTMVGYTFETLWYGTELDISTATITTMAPSESLVEGFLTALLYMHPNDRWRVYIPYNLGYDKTAKTKIPAYSTLIFDIMLKNFTSKR